MRCNLCGLQIAAGQPPRWTKDGHQIFICRGCGLIFRGDLPTSAELLQIYSRGYFQRETGRDADGYADYLGDEHEHRLTARRRLARLTEASAPGRLLDVGAAAGFFMDEARRCGWEADGIDVSPEMSRWGREHLDLAIDHGLFQVAEYPRQSFDAVTMWDYIEHSVDPAQDFAKAAEVLRPGGVLMLSTGDAGALVARLSGKRWHLLTPRHHNFFFTVPTLSRYLKENRFTIESVGHPGGQYSLRYLVYKLGTMAPRSRTVRAVAEWLAQNKLGERSLRFNLFDIVTIVARRAPDG